MPKRILPYPGSKWRIAKQIVEYFPDHHTYLEPYFGSGAVLFSKPRSDIETVNDIDDCIINFFECLRDHTDEFIWKVMTTPYARKEYESSFEKLYTAKDPMERAVALLVCCWQGHGTRLNEKVGWKADVQGRESAYAVKSWNTLPDIIRDTATRLKDVQIENKPAMSLIEKYDHADTLMYLDPPYPLSVRSGQQYRKEMTDREHEDLLEHITHAKARIMLSSYDNPMYDRYLKNWNRLSFQSSTVAGARREEIVWCNFSVPTLIQCRLF